MWAHKLTKTLETFLPFDLEFAFSAALHLTIAYALFHSEPAENPHTRTAQKIFQQLVSGGNKVAEARRADLMHIQYLLQEFSNRTEKQGMKSLRSLDGPFEHASPNIDDDRQGTSLSRMDSTALNWPLGPADDSSTFELTQEPLLQGIDCLEAIGISSNEFLSIVDQIGAQDVPHDIWDPPPTWMTRGPALGEEELNL